MMNGSFLGWFVGILFFTVKQKLMSVSRGLYFFHETNRSVTPTPNLLDYHQTFSEETLTFSYMQDEVLRALQALSCAPPAANKGRFMRRGQVGSWREELTRD